MRLPKSAGVLAAKGQSSCHHNCTSEHRCQRPARSPKTTGTPVTLGFSSLKANHTRWTESPAQNHHCGLVSYSLHFAFRHDALHTRAVQLHPARHSGRSSPTSYMPKAVTWFPALHLLAFLGTIPMIQSCLLGGSSTVTAFFQTLPPFPPTPGLINLECG